VTWATFQASSPAVAAEGDRLITRREIGEVLLATVRGDDPPRIHPIHVAIVDGRLYAFILRGPKRADLEQDGRYAMHTHQDPGAPSEFSVRARAHLVTVEARRARVAAAWSFEVDDTYGLFEFTVEAAFLGARRDADEWPPRYTSWMRGD